MLEVSEEPEVLKPLTTTAASHKGVNVCFHVKKTERSMKNHQIILINVSGHLQNVSFDGFVFSIHYTWLTHLNS